MYNTDTFRISRRKRTSHSASAFVRAYIYAYVITPRIPGGNDKKAYLAHSRQRRRILTLS